jgi:phosphoribosylformylglycinamidine synthase subunit PurL
LLVTLAESAVAGDIGIEVDLPRDLSPAQVLCSESPGRVVVTVPTPHVRDLAQLCGDADVPLADIGTVGGDRLNLEGLVDLGMDEVRRALTGGLAATLNS